MIRVSFALVWRSRSESRGVGAGGGAGLGGTAAEVPLSVEPGVARRRWRTAPDSFPELAL